MYMILSYYVQYYDNNIEHLSSYRAIKMDQHTLDPSNTYARSSDPSSASGTQPGWAQPTLISPAVTASNSKYHFPRVTAYDLSARNTRNFSAEVRHGSGATAISPKTLYDGNLMRRRNCVVQLSLRSR